MEIGTRLRHAWNAFFNKDPTRHLNYGSATSYRPDRRRYSHGNERSIIASIYNRIAADAASMTIVHALLDDEDRLKEVVPDGLNNCLTLEANIDQTGRAFIQDAVESMLDEGVVALVPIETEGDPILSNSYEIYTMRTARVITWYPNDVRLRLYRDDTGRQDELVLPKNMVSIIQNPFYAVMNEPSSTMQRLIRKLNILDVIDEQSGSGKLDLIIQVPYSVKSPRRLQDAERRRKELEDQLNGSKYGVAWSDSTEHIIQLNRSVDNNLMSQIEYLTSMLYSQLGITQSILDGTADEKTMANYYTRTIEPIVAALVDEMKRKFLTKAARSRKHSILFFRDPFKLIPVSSVAEIADKFTRNEIMTSNEIRQKIGMKPSSDPKADQLVNSNLNHPDEETVPAESNDTEETIE